MQEKEINILSLCYEILKKWRSIIIVGAICAIIFTGFSFFNESRLYNSQSSTTNVSYEEALANLTADEQKTVKSLVSSQEELNQYLDYLESSELMKLDPYNVNQVSMEYYVSGDSDVVMGSIKSYIQSNAAAKDILEKSGEDWSVQTLGELLEFKVMDTSSDSTINVINEEKSKLFLITVKAEKMKTANIIADALYDAINKYYKSKKIFSGSSISLADRSESVVTDTNLASLKATLNTNISNASARIATFTGTLTEPQKAVLALRNSEPSSVKNTEVVKPSIDIKKTIIGLFLGVLIMIALYTLLYILNKQLKYDEELKDNYEIKFIGSFLETINDKNPIDRLINKLDINNRKSKEESLNYLCKMIIYSCNGTTDSKVALVSTVQLNDTNMEKIKLLTDKLSKQGVNVEVIDDLLYAENALNKLSSYDNIVLVECVGNSTYSEIDREIELCKSQNRNIIGYIAI